MESFEVSVLNAAWSSESVLQNFSSALSTAQQADSRKRGLVDFCPSAFESRRWVHWELYGDKLCMHDVWLDHDLKNCAAIVDFTSESGREGPVRDVILGGQCGSVARSDSGYELHVRLLHENGVISVMALATTDKYASVLKSVVDMEWGDTVSAAQLIKKGPIQGMMCARIPIKTLTADDVHITCSKWVSTSTCLVGLSDSRIVLAQVSDEGIREAQYPDKSGFSRLLSDFMGTPRVASPLMAVDTIPRARGADIVMGVDQHGSIGLWDSHTCASLGTYALAGPMMKKVTELHGVMTATDLIESQSGVCVVTVGFDCTTSDGRGWTIAVMECGMGYGEATLSPLCELATPAPTMRCTLTAIKVSSQLDTVLSMWDIEESDAVCHPSVLATVSMIDIFGSRGNGEALPQTCITSNYDALRRQYMYEDSLLSLSVLSAGMHTPQEVQTNIEKVLLRRVFLEGRFTEAAIRATLALDNPFRANVDFLTTQDGQCASPCSAALVLKACRERTSKLMPEDASDETFFTTLIEVFASFVEACDARMINMRRGQPGQGSSMAVLGEESLVKLAIAGRGTVSLVIDSVAGHMHHVAKHQGCGPSARAQRLVDIATASLQTKESLALYEIQYRFDQGDPFDEEYIESMRDSVFGLSGDVLAMSAASTEISACLQGSGGLVGAKFLLEDISEHYLWNYDSKGTERHTVASCSRYGARVSGSIANLFVLEKFRQSRAVCALFIFLSSMRGNLDRSLLNLLDAFFIKRALATLVHVVFLRWTSTVAVSSQNKLDNLINFNDMDSEMVFARTCYGWRVGVVEEYMPVLSATKSLWHSLWHNLNGKIKLDAVTRGRTGHPDLALTPSIGDMLRSISEALRPSPFSDFQFFIKEAKELVVAKSATAIAHLVICYSEASRSSALVGGSDGSEVHERTLISAFTASRAKSASIEHLLLRTSSASVTHRVLYKSFSELLGSIPALDASTVHRGSRTAQSHAPCSQGDFTNLVTQWVKSQKNTDRAAMIAGALLDMALMDEFLAHVGPHEGEQCVSDLLSASNSDFLVAFAVLSQHLRGLEVMSRSRAMLPSHLGFDLALKFGYACLQVTKQVSRLFATSIPGLDARVVKIHHCIFRFALSESALDESFTSILKMVEVAERLGDDFCRGTWKDSLRAFVTKCCTSQSLGWLCKLRDIRVGSVDMVEEVQREMSLLAEVTVMGAQVEQSGRMVSDDGAAAVNYHECLFALLLSRQRYKEAASVATRYVQILHTTASPQGAGDAARLAETQRKWTSLINHSLALLPEDEAFVLSEDEGGEPKALGDVTLDHAFLRMKAQLLRTGGVQEREVSDKEELLRTLGSRDNLLQRSPDLAHHTLILATLLAQQPGPPTAHEMSATLRQLALKSQTKSCMHDSPGTGQSHGSGPGSAVKDVSCFFSSYGRVTTPLSTGPAHSTSTGWLPLLDSLFAVDEADWKGHSAVAAEVCRGHPYKLPLALVDSFFAGAAEEDGGAPRRGNPEQLLHVLFTHGKLVDACTVAVRILKEQSARPAKAELWIPYTQIDRLLIACELVVANPDVDDALRDAHYAAKDALQTALQHLFQAMEVRELC